MKRIGKKRQGDIEPDLTSFSDIANLLIIFFILTTTLARPWGRQVDMPSAATPPQQQKQQSDTPTVNLTKDRITISDGGDEAGAFFGIANLYDEDDVDRMKDWMEDAEDAAERPEEKERVRVAAYCVRQLENYLAFKEAYCDYDFAAARKAYDRMVETANNTRTNGYDHAGGYLEYIHAYPGAFVNAGKSVQYAFKTLYLDGDATFAVTASGATAMRSAGTFANLTISDFENSEIVTSLELRRIAMAVITFIIMRYSAE